MDDIKYKQKKEFKQLQEPVNNKITMIIRTENNNNTTLFLKTLIILIFARYLNIFFLSHRPLFRVSNDMRCVLLIFCCELPVCMTSNDSQFCGCAIGSVHILLHW